MEDAFRAFVILQKNKSGKGIIPAGVPLSVDTTDFTEEIVLLFDVCPHVGETKLIRIDLGEKVKSATLSVKSTQEDVISETFHSKLPVELNSVDAILVTISNFTAQSTRSTKIEIDLEITACMEVLGRNYLFSVQSTLSGTIIKLM